MKDPNIESCEADGLKAGFFAGYSLPLVIEPQRPGFDLLRWLSENKERYTGLLTQYGAILFRGFNCDLRTFAQNASGELLPYTERSSPRHAVGERIYTSTDYPPTEEIFFHNENSYARSFPAKIFFSCLTEPGSRGGTPIADCRKVYQRMDPAVREKFEAKGILYVRNFSRGLGLSWEEAFHTEDRSVVEEYCRKNSVSWEWKPDGGLRTRQVNPASQKHPVSGEMTWFNHATFFHISTLPQEIRDYLLETTSMEDLPNNTYYGDGEMIESDVLKKLREIYRAESMVFPWKKGDILALDNLLVAHAREPFTGDRKIIVAMAEPRAHSWNGAEKSLVH